MKQLLFLSALLLFLCPPVFAGLRFSSEPRKIIIPSVGISLPVYPAKIAYNTWEVRMDGASYGEGTALPGNEGNTVIFSHALPFLFKNLVSVRRGDFIEIFTDVDWFTYRVTDVEVVDPENVDAIFRYDSHGLSLYTCTGQNYTKRFIVKATLLYPLSKQYARR